MALAKVWQNQFLDAALHWQGRGPGNLGPLGDAVLAFESTAPVAILSGPNAVWPKSTKQEDGYRFLGYRLDDKGQPTFRYRVGMSEVSDFLEPIPANEDGLLGFKRVITVHAEDDGLFYRFATGEIERVGETTYRINGSLVMDVAESNAELVSVDGRSELRVAIPSGKVITVSQTMMW